MAFGINIWDDYWEDGHIPEGEFQGTYAYVEGGKDDDKRDEKVLKEFEAYIVTNFPELLTGVEHEVVFYDSRTKYPTLEEMFQFTRWQLNFKHLTHEQREALVKRCKGAPWKVYSES